MGKSDGGGREKMKLCLRLKHTAPFGRNPPLFKAIASVPSLPYPSLVPNKLLVTGSQAVRQQA